MSETRWIAAALVALSVALMGLVDTLAQPGYELALVVGFLCPSVAAVANARELLRRSLGPFSAFCHCVGTAVGLSSLAYLVALVRGFFAGYCDLGAATQMFVLGPGIGTIMGGLWGGIAAELARSLTDRPTRRSVLAVVLAIGGPVGSALVQLALFYLTPMVFAFDPFIGFFSGALYDTIISGNALLSYRAASATSLFACYVLTLHLKRDKSTGKLKYGSLGRPGLLLSGALAAVASLYCIASGSELGHWQTARSIQAELGGAHQRGRCRVLHDRSISTQDVVRLARDCDAHVRSIEQWLESKTDQLVTVYLFRDVQQKKRLMGAARTSIAKPWRGEIYIQASGYPHPVLRHELIHVLAAPLGRGPFAVAGSWGGWLPTAGLIEGLAVAAAPRDDNLSAEQWAAAMKKIGVLPSVSNLFALSFLTGHSATSYTAAGAFVQYIRGRFGAAAIKRWYGGEELAAIAGQGWTELERGWHQQLAKVELTEAALAEARARFDRPGVFGRRCPHVVDRSLREAGAQQALGDLDGALASYQRVLSLDSHNVSASLGMARCRDRRGESQLAQRSLTELSTSDWATKSTQLLALERLGDLALRAAKPAQARALYDRARKGVVSEHRLRRIDIKHHYAASEAAREALLALLVGRSHRGPNHNEALDLIGHWRSSAPTDATPDYLFARQHIAAGNYHLAARRLDQALAKKQPLVRVLNETLRKRIEVACALGKADRARTALKQYASRPKVSTSRLAWARALVQRCTASGGD